MGAPKVVIFILLSLATGLGQDLPQDTARAKNMSAGADYYRSVLKKRPGLPEAHFGAGWEAYHAQDFPQARNEFEGAAQTDNQELKSKVLYNLGNTWYQEGQFEPSLEAYRRALQLNPRDRDAKHNYELALNMVRKPPEENREQTSQDSEREDPTKDSARNEAGDRRVPPEAMPRDAEVILNALEASGTNLMKRRWIEQESATLEKDW